MGSTVVRRSNGSESFLPRGIPDLQLDCFAIQLDGSDLKVNSNGGNVVRGVGIISKSQKQTRLSDSRVSNQQQLEKIVVFVIHGSTIITPISKEFATWLWVKELEIAIK
jgi:hypothetical protein